MTDQERFRLRGERIRLQRRIAIYTHKLRELDHELTDIETKLAVDAVRRAVREPDLSLPPPPTAA